MTCLYFPPALLRRTRLRANFDFDQFFEFGQFDSGHFLGGQIRSLVCSSWANFVGVRFRPLEIGGTPRPRRLGARRVGAQHLSLRFLLPHISPFVSLSGGFLVALCLRFKDHRNCAFGLLWEPKRNEKTPRTAFVAGRHKKERTWAVQGRAVQGRGGPRESPEINNITSTHTHPETSTHKRPETSTHSNLTSANVVRPTFFFRLWPISFANLGVPLRPIGRSRNWPKSKLVHVAYPLCWMVVSVKDAREV